MVHHSSIQHACVAVALLLQITHSKMRVKRGSRLGKQTRRRNRGSVKELYDQLGDYYFRRAYRMTYVSFLKLHELLKPHIDFVIHRRRNKTSAGGVSNRTPPNGIIHSSLRLAIALRYFAGGSLYELSPLYGVGFTDCKYSVWYIVQAINACPEMKIKYPTDHNEQRKIAAAFEEKSTVGFTGCAGAVDGLLIWIHRPAEFDAKAAECDAGKFFCARKNKFGLNCQAVSDSRGKILDMSINYPGSTSDLLAFEASDLYMDCQNNPNFLAEGLCIFGDNAYVNTRFLATPYPNVSSGPPDSYNFYHSQLRIRVECCFGVLVQRWGILRSALGRGFTLAKSVRLVKALGKLHNFCIDEKQPLHRTSREDEALIRCHREGSIQLDSVATDMNGTREPVPRQLIGSGHHFDDCSTRRRAARLRQTEQHRLAGIMPREIMLQQVIDGGYTRPTPKPRRH